MYQQQQAAAGGSSSGGDHRHSNSQQQANGGAQGGGRGAPDAWAKLRALQQAAQETGFAVMYTHPEMNAPEVKDAVARILAAQGYRVGADAEPVEGPAAPSQQPQQQPQQQRQQAAQEGSWKQEAAPDTQPAWGVLGDVGQLEAVAAALDERGERDGALLASLQKRWASGFSEPQGSGMASHATGWHMQLPDVALLEAVISAAWHSVVVRVDVDAAMVCWTQHNGD